MSATSPPRRVLAMLVAAPLLAGVLASCVSTDDSDAAGGNTIDVALTSEGCAPPKRELQAGSTTFHASNEGASKVSELELLRGDRIVGERENLTPGLDGTFTVTLTAGDYELYCPGAETDRTTITVTGEPQGVHASPEEQAALQKGVADYKAYVDDQFTQLLAHTKAFAQSVAAGNVEEAKARYAEARIYYERVEPVAERFGPGGRLDLHIDGRINDFESPAEFQGFHRIEQALWEQNTTQGMAPVADQLVADVTKLQHLVSALTYAPDEIANGATALLDEVAKTKITGEEERYSHLDVLDIAGNVQGAHEAFSVLEPALRISDPALADTIDTRFADLEQALASFEAGDGYVTYDKLTEQQVRDLSAKVDALADPLSQVAANVSGKL